MAEQTTTAPKKKGTVKTEQIIGTGLSKFQQATKALEDSFKQFSGLSELVQKQSLEIADKEAKIQELDIQYKEKKRQGEVNLDTELKAYGRELAIKILNENLEVAIDSGELTQLRNKAQLNEEQVKKDKDAAVTIATNSLKAIYEAEKRVKESEFKAEQAKAVAELSQKDAQIKFLDEQVTVWKTQLDEERKASVQRAQASSIGAVNVTSGK